MLGFARHLSLLGWMRLQIPGCYPHGCGMQWEDASESYTLSIANLLWLRYPLKSIVIQNLKVAFVGETQDVVAPKRPLISIKERLLTCGGVWMWKSTILQTILRSLPPPAVIRGGRILWGEEGHNLFETPEEKE